MPVTRGGAGARNIECFDCHNSHGSTVSGVTSSYRTFDGTYSSGLPRLMQTNCFEQGPAGLRESSGVPWLPYKKVGGNSPSDQVTPKADVQSGSQSKNKIVGCHVRQFGKATAASHKELEGVQWKDVTSW